MKHGPLVSVIIPTYNRADKVGEAISSVLSQSYKNLDILVIDDGSLDTTGKIVSRFPQVRYIKQEHAGQAAARNNGLRNSRGSIIANLDSDDLWNPNFIKYCVEKLEKDQLDFVFANWMQQTKKGIDEDFMKKDLFLRPFFPRLKDSWIHLENNDLRDLYLRACPSPSSAVVMRKSSIPNGWDETIHIGDDWALYLDMILSKPCRAAFTTTKLWQKRIDEMNIFDGRARAEVLNLLYNADIGRFISRHKPNLSKNELRSLNRLHTYSLVELSKHKILREFDLKGSVRLFTKACSINLLLSLRAIPVIFFRGIARKVDATKLNELENDNEGHRKASREFIL